MYVNNHEFHNQRLGSIFYFFKKLNMKNVQIRVQRKFLNHIPHWKEKLQITNDGKLRH